MINRFSLFSAIKYYCHRYLQPESFGVSCKLITASWNYLIVSSYFWIFVEGFYLHNIIYWNIFKEPSVWPYAAIAWGKFI